MRVRRKILTGTDFRLLPLMLCVLLIAVHLMLSCTVLEESSPLAREGASIAPEEPAATEETSSDVSRTAPMARPDGPAKLRDAPGMADDENEREAPAEKVLAWLATGDDPADDGCGPEDEVHAPAAETSREAALREAVAAEEEPRPATTDLARARELVEAVARRARAAATGAAEVAGAEEATPRAGGLGRAGPALSAPAVETSASASERPTVVEGEPPFPPPASRGATPAPGSDLAPPPAPTAASSREPPVLAAGDGAGPSGTVPEEKRGPLARKPVPRPPGAFVFKTMFHKTSSEFMDFVGDFYPEWVTKGHVAKVRGKGRTVVIFGEKPGEADDPMIKKISQAVDYFDDLELNLEQRVIRPRYAPLDKVMDALVMRGLANVWHLVEETDTLTWKEGNKNRTVARKHPGYIQSGMVRGAVAPIDVPPKVPYVYEMPSQDTFVIPPQYSGQQQGDKILMTFDKTSSTEERGGMVAVGTAEDLERIQEFVDSIDIPARRIMIEIQVIELEASKLVDFGFDSAQYGSGHEIGSLALPLPGEPIKQPGLGEAFRDPSGAVVPPVLTEGFEFIFDDTSLDLSGRFLTTVHALVREGDAKVKARPKILTLDDRTSVLHLGRELPTFKSTGLTRDSVDGNLISEVREVTTQYVGITLNLRPRVAGGAEDEVSLQIEVIVNELAERERVFEEDLLGIPAVTRRHYVGENRVKNHRPMILGGLIQEQEVESVSKIPLLADIPLLGYLFRRTQSSETRSEIILVVTPHILSEKGVDRVATPKESIHFDTFDSVLFNDRHIIKGSDVLGIDPINNAPAPGFEPEQILDLTLLNIVRKRQLVSKLNILEEYLGDDVGRLNWMQRKWPESTVRDWPEAQQELYFRAAAICIDNIKELNTDLTYGELILPRREIVLPTSPYRISLSYDRVKSLQELGNQYVLRGERVELDEGMVEVLKNASGRSLRSFGDYLERHGRKAEEHADVLPELKRLYSGLHPENNVLEGVAYPEVYRELEKASLDFVSLATYFQTNLEDRYQVSGLPDVGLFQADLVGYLKTAVGLVQRARELKELDDKWRKLNEVGAEDE